MVEPANTKTRNEAPELVKIAKLLTKEGPNINLIARTLGVYKETVRYRVKNKILRKGFDLQATVDCEALGLVRIAVKAKLSGAFEPFAKQLFYSLSELSYLASYQQAMPDDFWMLHFSVPLEFQMELEDFIINLKELGIFTSVDFLEFDWFRNAPMKAEYYDFESNRWDFDWTSSSDRAGMSQGTKHKSRKIDWIDLLILKELEIDATSSLREIRDSLASKKNGDLKYQTLEWHYRTHVLRKGLIKGYTIRWLGTGYDAELDKVGQRQHKYVVLNVVVRNVTQSERLKLSGAMNHLPFLWAEMAGRDYAAQLAFPVEMVNEAMLYLSEVIHPVVERAQVFAENQRNSVSFTIPYRSWNIVDKRWGFEKEPLLARFQSLVLEVRNGRVV